MNDKVRKAASGRALTKLKQMYPKEYQKFYFEELQQLNLKPAKEKEVDEEINETQAEKIIAERMMTTQYLMALMQEGVVSNKKLDIDIEPVDVTLRDDYDPPEWDESPWYRTYVDVGLNKKV